MTPCPAEAPMLFSSSSSTGLRFKRRRHNPCPHHSWYIRSYPRAGRGHAHPQPPQFCPAVQSSRNHRTQGDPISTPLPIIFTVMAGTSPTTVISMLPENLEKACVVPRLFKPAGRLASDLLLSM